MRPGVEHQETDADAVQGFLLNLVRGNGKMLPKKGKVLPVESADGAEVSYAKAISVALQKELGQSHRAVKTVMRWTGASERTVKNWVSGERGPSGAYLVDLIRHSDEIMQCILHMADRHQTIAASKLPDIAKRLQQALELFEQGSCTDP